MNADSLILIKIIRTMSSQTQSMYIADGFADDCDELIHRCLQAGTQLNFEIFSNVWKEMQMSCIYQGRSSGAEIAELSEEVIHIAKHYMVADTSNFEESVAGLFLVYSLINLQPYPNFAKLRIVQDDLPAIERIEVVARRDRRLDVLYILGSVLIKGPVQYHAAERERGMEYPIRKYLEGASSIDKIGLRPKGVFYRQNPELDLIRELKDLTMQYNMAKQNIEGVNPDEHNLNYFDGNFANELESSLKNIISGIIDNDDGDDKGGTSGSCDAIKNIKDKAMKAKVKHIRHRVGVAMRTTSQSEQVETDPPPDKTKTVSPKRPTYKNKTKDRPKKRVRKPKSNSSDSDDYTIKEASDTQDDLSSSEELDITKFHQPNTSEIEQEVNIKIDDLPDVIRTEIEGQSFEIEVIDKLNMPSTSANTDPVLTSTASETELPSKRDKVKRPDKRDLKKTLVKSRFKRMGMLPVANFQNK